MQTNIVTYIIISLSYAKFWKLSVRFLMGIEKVNKCSKNSTGILRFPLQYIIIINGISFRYSVSKGSQFG